MAGEALQPKPGLRSEESSTGEKMGVMGPSRSSSAREKVVPGGLEASKEGIGSLDTPDGSRRMDLHMVEASPAKAG